MPRRRAALRPQISPSTPLRRPRPQPPGSLGPDLARAAWGAACLLAPGPVGRALGGREPDARARRVLRVLGGRHLVQAAGTRLLPPHLLAPRLVLVASAAVDGLHAGSALVLALADPARRRSALSDALVAAGWSAWTAVRARRSA